jgi:hypothetical protein
VAAFNDLKLYELADALLADVLGDGERVRVVVKRLKVVA